jgi:hypothetical protein
MSSFEESSCRGKEKRRPRAASGSQRAWHNSPYISLRQLAVQLAVQLAAQAIPKAWLRSSQQSWLVFWIDCRSAQLLAKSTALLILKPKPDKGSA